MKRVGNLKMWQKTLIGTLFLAVIASSLWELARWNGGPERVVRMNVGEPEAPLYIPPIPPLPAAQPPGTLAVERIDLERIEAQCIELVAKLRPAVVGVLSPSKASRPRSKRHAGGAAGVLINADGLVLSQLHVSHMRLNSQSFSDLHQPGEEATVFLADGRECKAKLLGGNSLYDLSLLQLSEPGPYPFVSFLPESQVQTGDWVVKLGHPLSFRADRPAPARLGRVLASSPEGFVTDCQCISGDSGGPFFDLDGRLVGIIHGGDTLLMRDAENGAGISTEGYSLFFSAISSPRIATLLESMQKAELPKASPQSQDVAGLTGTQRLNAEYWTQGANLKNAFRPLTEPFQKSVIAILNHGVAIALGTVVDDEGLLVVKASDLPLKPQCRLPDGTVVDAHVLGVDKPFDLAFLQIPPNSVHRVIWADRDDVPAGTVVAAVGLDGELLMVGIVSVATRDLADVAVPAYNLPLRVKAGSPDVYGEPSQAGGLSLKVVRGHARDAGLLPGDQLVSIAGRKIATRDDLAASVSNNLSGDVVPVTYVRNGEASTLHLPLHAGATSSIAKYRADDFPTALEYSPPVRFTASGGPLIDLAGRVIGITVGPSAEHAGWAIPADCVRRLIAAAKRGELTTWPE